MQIFKAIGLLLALLMCVFSGCDFGTYSARVEARIDELENPTNDDGFEEGEERIPDTKLFHAAFIDFYQRNGRPPSGWPEMLQFCNSFGESGRKFAYACENFEKQGAKGNWKLEKGLDQAAMHKKVILYKKDGKPRIFGSGLAVDF